MALRFRDGVSTAETEYGTVLLDEHSGRYWQLNPSGALVARTLLDGGTHDEAVAALRAEFEVEEERAEQDVTALVTQLRSAGLVAP